MTTPRRQYSRTFKEEAVQLWQTSGKSAPQVEKELGIGSGLLHKWKAALRAGGSEAFPGQGKSSASEEKLRQLERELEIVKQERDILKKAVAIFAQPPR